MKDPLPAVTAVLRAASVPAHERRPPQKTRPPYVVVAEAGDAMAGQLVPLGAAEPVEVELHLYAESVDQVERLGEGVEEAFYRLLPYRPEDGSWLLSCAVRTGFRSGLDPALYGAPGEVPAQYHRYIMSFSSQPARAWES